MDLGADTASGGHADGDDLDSIENLIGSAYDDTLSGDGGANVIDGGAGNDIISGGGGADTLNGEAGNDVIEGGTGADTIDGGTGNDTASYVNAGGTVAANLLAGTGTRGDATGDTFTDIENLIGSAFADALIGDGGANVIDGGAGNDDIIGVGGDDTLHGGAGNDYISGGSGADTLHGGAGGDRLSGGSEDDVLFGDGDNDVLLGGAGNDALDGGAGDDTLDGGAGTADVLFGGTGADSFVFASLADGGDLVRDFVSGVDRVEIVGAGFGLAAIGQITADMYESGAGLPATLTATDAVFYLDTQGQGLWFDPTGGATDDIQLVAVFETGTPLQADIFIV